MVRPRAPEFELRKISAMPPFVVPSAVRSRKKRALDVLVATLAAVVSLPFALLIAAAIRLDSPGGVFFWQERIGYEGRKFRMLKFRTMRANVSDERHRQYVVGLVDGQKDEHDGNGVYKLTDDDRVTRVGQFLRKTSLDELPQIWNVLVGDMTIVGPRPPLPYEVDRYEPWQMRRLMLRPGITGLWQVSGRNHLSYRRMCELDIEYLETWTFSRDIKILLRTIPVVLTNSGSAH